jgi:hypothetical protein
MKSKSVLLAIPFFAVVALADFVCYLQWNGTLHHQTLSSFNESYLSFPFSNNVTGGSHYQNQTMDIHLPINQTLVKDFIDGLHFGRIVFENSSNFLILDPSIINFECEALRLIPLSFCDYRNTSDLSNHLFNQTDSLIFPNTNDTTGPNNTVSTPDHSDSDLLIPSSLGFKNCSELLEDFQLDSFPVVRYFSCVCDSFLHFRNQTSLNPRLPSEPPPPLRVQYIPETHKLNIEPRSSLLIPPQWLQGETLPFVNCSVIFQRESLLRMSDGNSNFPNCSWVEKNSSTILAVSLPRQSLLRQHDEVVFNFFVTEADTIVNSIYAYHPEVESMTQYSTQNLLSIWGLYRERRFRYIEMIQDYSGNRTIGPQLNWTIIVSSSTRSPTSHPSSTPTLIPSLTPTFSPSSHHPTIIPTYYPTISPTSRPTTPINKRTPTMVPTKSPLQPPSFLPTSVPSLFEKTEASSQPSAASLLDCLVEFKTPIVPLEVTSKFIHLRVRFPSTIYSPCLTIDCLQPQIFSPNDHLELDASASYTDSIFPLHFSWSILAVSENPLCSQYLSKSTADTDCSLKYSPEILASAMTALHEFVSNSVSSVLQIPNTLLLAGVQYTFRLELELENTWAERISMSFKNYTFHVMTSPHPLPTLTISESNPLTRAPFFLETGLQDPIILSSGNQSFLIDKEIIWSAASRAISPRLFLPSKFSSNNVDIFRYQWEIYELSRNSSFDWVPVLALASHDFYFSIPNSFTKVAKMKNMSIPYLLHLTVFTGAKELSPSTSSLLLFENTSQPNAIILGGSRCIFPDVDLVLESYDIGSSSSKTRFRWSCWVTDTYNRDSYNIGRESTFDSYTQCSSGNEFYGVMHEITEFDRITTASKQLSSGSCSGYVHSQDDSTLHLEAGTLQFGVKYKFCVEMFSSVREGEGEGVASIDCIGVYVYIPVNSEANHFTGVNMTWETDQRKLDTRESSWQPFQLLTPFLAPSKDSPLKTTKYSMSSEYPLKLTIQTASPSQLICDSSTYPFTTWRFHSQVPPIYSFHPKILKSHQLKNAQNFVTFPLSSTSSSVFGYSSFKYSQHSFSPGHSFTFSVSSSCSFKESQRMKNDNAFLHRGYSEITIALPQTPRDGSFQVLPDSGVSFETKGYLSQSNWIVQESDDLPLQYSFYYTTHYSTSSTSSSTTTTVKISDFEDSEEIICLHDWSFDPSHNFTFPMINRFPFFDESSSIWEFWNTSIATTLDPHHHSTENIKVVIHGLVRNSNDIFSSMTHEINISTPWDPSFDEMTSLVSVIDQDNMIEVNEFQEKLRKQIQIIHLEVKNILDHDCYDLYLQQNHLNTYHCLYGISIVLNSFPIHYLDDEDEVQEEIFHERYELRSFILELLFNSSQWTSQSNLDTFSSYPHLSYHLIVTIIKATSLSDEISENSKIYLVKLIQLVVSRSVKGASQSFWGGGSGYFSPRYCSQFYTLKTVTTIEDLLTTLDRMAPIVDPSFNVLDSPVENNEVRRRNEMMYKQILLDLKALLVGCALPGERVASSGESNDLPENAMLGTSFPTSQPTALRLDHVNITNNSSENGTHTNENENGTMTQTNMTTSSPSFSPTQVTTQRTRTVKRYGSQIGVLRQSIYGKFSQASVTVGNEVNFDQMNFTKTETVVGKNQSNVTEAHVTTITTLTSSSRVDHEPFSFLQLPCDTTTHFNSCKMTQTQLSLSRGLGNEMSIEDAFSLISKQDSVIDLSILNVPILEPASYELDGVDRTWVPSQKNNSGVSDAVIVQFKTSATINQSFFNLTNTIEVGVRVSRPDVLWKLAVVNPDNNNNNVTNVNIGNHHFLGRQRRFLRGNEPPPGEQLEPDIPLIFSPRWVRCELFDADEMSWVKPDWLDGWWSPDVASFATEGELKNAAQKYGTRSVGTGSPSASSSITSYLAVNNSVSMLPTSLSCFLNSIMISSENENGTSSSDHSIWLQWRTVSQTQDPCGGCSGHGICVLFRTAPLCLCQENYEGRFCDKFVATNSTRDSSSSREWHLTTPLAPSGLKGIAYLISFIISFIILFQIIKRVVCYLMTKEGDDIRPLYSLLGTDEVDTMTTSQFVLENTSTATTTTGTGMTNFNLLSHRDVNHNFHPAEVRCYSDLPLTSSSVTLISIMSSSVGSEAVPRSNRSSWVSNLSLRCQQYFQFRVNENVDRHRDDDRLTAAAAATDRSEENGLFVSSQTDGNGIEIIDTRFPESLANIQTHQSQGDDRHRNLSSHQLTVRGINMFTEESKSLRDYGRVKGKPTDILTSEVDHEKDQGLRQRKSTNIS